MAPEKNVIADETDSTSDLPVDMSVQPLDGNGRLLTAIVGMGSISFELTAEQAKNLGEALLPTGEAAFLRRAARTEFAGLSVKGRTDEGYSDAE